MKISLISAYKDNYIFVLELGRSALVIDPGSSDEVLNYLNKNGLSLERILVTHYHWDHVDGVADLQSVTGADLYGPESLSAKGLKCTRVVSDGDVFEFKGLKFVTLGIPGHTLDHLSYYCAEQNILFCGDTLFSLGCGRIFEGDSNMMFRSLARLKGLPDATTVYCAHEYTLRNLEFSINYLKATGASDRTLGGYLHLLSKVSSLREHNLPTVPSSLEFEKLFNLFLKAESPEAFSKIREARNNF